MTTTGTPTTRGPAAGTTTDVRPGPRYAWCRRGRHRRPRPRKVLLVVGGLALAAGALSLVRLLPEPPGDAGDGVRAGAAPRVEGGGGDTAADVRATPSGAADAGGGVPGPVASATSVMGGLSGSPGPGLIPGIPGLVPDPSASGTPAAGAPEGPDTPENGKPGERHEREEDHERGKEGDRPRAPAPDTARPQHSDRPAPHPAPTTPTPPPPSTPPAPEPADPGLCVPVIGLCVGLFTG
ncbi:hypothetical protein ACFV4X_05285 [Streptomyces ardesiacus]|uniref:hypothetical protein n=1 Tax=Streptomyces ardesiacus TaxID=285564 RepID=UPI0036523652